MLLALLSVNEHLSSEALRVIWKGQKDDSLKHDSSPGLCNWSPSVEYLYTCVRLAKNLLSHFGGALGSGWEEAVTSGKNMNLLNWKSISIRGIADIITQLWVIIYDSDSQTGTLFHLAMPEDIFCGHKLGCRFYWHLVDRGQGCY